MVIWIMAAFLGGYFLHIVQVKIRKDKNVKTIIGDTLESLDNIIAIMSGIVFVFCTVYDATTGNTDISIQYLNIFSTIILSWIVTRKSTEIQCKKEQQKTAKVSYRHLSDLEYTILEAQQGIEEYLENNPCSTKHNTINSALEKTKTMILIMQQATKTNKEDWFDLLDEEYQKELTKKINENEEEAPPNIDAYVSKSKVIFKDDIINEKANVTNIKNEHLS